MTSPNDPPPNSLAGWTLSIFTDILTNLTHDTVLQAHRNEKLLRTQQYLNHKPPPSNTSSSEDPSNIPLTINPLSVQPIEYTCPRCHLPRHTAATMNQGTAGEKKKFCSKLPYVNRPRHDIYGNPFSNVSAAKDKKSKASQTQKEDASSTCGDSPAASISANGTDLDVPIPTSKGKGGGTAGIVYFKCLTCDNEKVAHTRFTAHLDKCFGTAGRKSSRVAMAKFNNQPPTTASPLLAPADAKNGSRKPSPEKNGRSPAPLPVEEAAVKVTTTTTVAATAATTGSATATPKKKKKPNAIPRAISEDHPHVPIQSSGKALPLPPIPKDPTNPAPPKKRKRKVEAPAAVGTGTDIPNPDASTERGKEKEKEKEKEKDKDKDASITLSKPPLQKKQKLTPTTVMQPAGGVDKKNPISKFKNRAASPSPSGTPRKGIDMNRSRSDGNPAVPPLPIAPTSSPPISNKPLPAPTSGSPLSSGSPLKTPSTKVVKKKITKKPSIAGSGVAGKTLPKISKKVVSSGGVGGVTGAGAGAEGSPKKVKKAVKPMSGGSVPVVGRGGIAGKSVGERK